MFRAYLLIGLLLGSCSGPLGPFPGGKLNGEIAKAPNDWTVAEDVEHIQLETVTSIGEPHSVNIWCVVYEGRLFVSTSLVRGAENPTDRTWVKHALSNENVRVRVHDKIYLGTIRRVENAEITAIAKSKMMKKYGTQTDERHTRAWIFEIVGS